MLLLPNIQGFMLLCFYWINRFQEYSRFAVGLVNNLRKIEITINVKETGFDEDRF